MSYINYDNTNLAMSFNHLYSAYNYAYVKFASEI